MSRIRPRRDTVRHPPARVEPLEGRRLFAAVPVAIANAGFESPALANGAFTNNSIPNWTGSDAGAVNNFGVYNPPTSYFPSEAPAGQNVAYIERGAIYQTLSTKLAAGKYVLTAKVGNSLADPASPYRVQLRAGTTVLAEVTSPLPARGTFRDVTVSYTAAAGSPLLGQSLQVRFVEVNADKSSELYVDKVGLTFESAATPTFSLVDGVLTVAGTSGADYVRGSVASNVLTMKMNNLTQTFANASSITRIVVNGLAGNDVIILAASVKRPTTLNGGDGNDTIHGGDGPDTINGGAGTDSAFRGVGDTVTGVEEVLA